MKNMPLYDRIRKTLADHLDASIELQEANITWYMTHPEEYKRVEERLREQKCIDITNKAEGK